MGKVEEMRPVGGAVLSRVKIDSRQRLGNEMPLNHKDPIVVNFNCDCLKYPLDDVTLSLVAHRKADGCRCFNVLSHASGCYLNKRKNSVELVVKNHNLVPGQYVFDVEIKSLKAGRVIAIHREREVVIKSPDEYMNPGLYGVYQPENVSWKINPLSD